MIKLSSISLAIIAAFILAVACSGDTNSVETGIVIKARPVIYVTMETNHVYALWHKGSLLDEWELMWPFGEMVVSNTPKRMVMEWSESAPTGFFFLEVDGEGFPTNNVANAAVSTGVPPIPTGE